MNSVDRVKCLCKERKIPISRLEKDLGFSNGYIGQLKKGVFPADRLKEISDYLKVSVDYLMTGQEKEATAYDAMAGEIIAIYETLNDSFKQDAIDYLRFLAYKSKIETNNQ